MAQVPPVCLEGLYFLGPLGLLESQQFQGNPACLGDHRCLALLWILGVRLGLELQLCQEPPVLPVVQRHLSVLALPVHPGVL